MKQFTLWNIMHFIKILWLPMAKERKQQQTTNHLSDPHTHLKHLFSEERV